MKRRLSLLKQSVYDRWNGLKVYVNARKKLQDTVAEV